MSYNETYGSICNQAQKVKICGLPKDKTISAGKNTYVYDAHTYHTKVPPEGIETMIEHFTNEGDIVLDPFCGSGMTGIAAQRTGRKALLSDLSPAATFIAKNMNTPIDAESYWSAVQTLLRNSADLQRKLYTTSCRECGKDTTILYTVWSYKLICNHCNQEFLLWDVAKDERESVKESKIRTEFPCPHCGALLKKRVLKRTTIEPVAIGYKCCTKSLKEKCCELSSADREFLHQLSYESIPKNLWYPKNKFPGGINTRQPISCGIDSVDKAYFPRALWAFSFLWNEANKWEDPVIREKLLFTLTSLYQRITKFSEFRFWGGSGNTANYNVPKIINEQNVFLAFERKAKTIYLYFKTEAHFSSSNFQISTQSACHLSQLKDNSVDYVFTDPPFGSNINYSEMNFLWESWLQQFTVTDEEAIVNSFQGKGNAEYEKLMEAAFSEIHRVLKTEGWLTIVFHNSSAAIWDELQRAIYNSGFSIDGTMILDKKHGTFKQFVSENAVGFDLMLCCQKKSQSATAYQVRSIKEEEAEIKKFIADQIRLYSIKSYIVKFEHVHRQNEVDYRKLYSEWLAKAIGREYIKIDFNHFRIIASEVIHNQNKR